MKAAAVLLVTATLATGCSGDDALRVSTAEVGRANVAEVVDAPGTIAARATAAITAPATATVDAVFVEDGATVAKGAVLARLASPQATDRLRQALLARENANAAEITVPRADLGPLQDQLDAAAAASAAAGRAAAAQLPDPAMRAAVERQVAAAQQQYAVAAYAARATLDQVDAGAQGLESALAALAAGQRAQADAAVAAARATVDALTVRAPIAGVVTLGAGSPTAAGPDLSGALSQLPSALQGQASQLLGSGAAVPATTTLGLAVGTAVTSGQPLLTVTDVAGLSVTADVDETDVLLVTTGIGATVEVDAVPGSTYQAKVTAVDLAPTTASTGGVSYRVRLELGPGRVGEDVAPRPRPGMSSVVNLRVRTAKATIAIASSAVLRDEGRDAVFVVKNGKAERRLVRLGAQGEDRVEVLDGLSTGEQVVIRDADRLSDGQAVTS